MNDDREVQALLTLIDDPDIEIFEAVSSRIIDYGSLLIPDLESLWEQAQDTGVQERIELLIHRLHFTNLKNDFSEWVATPYHDLLPASLLVAKFLYPDLQTARVLHNIERLRRNIWLEINHYLTPLEKVNVINSILYNYFGIKGNTIHPPKISEFLIPNIIESKKGNQTGIGNLYILLTEMLDIPVKLLPIPGQFVLGYVKSEENIGNQQHNIEFFIEPSLGQIFTHNDLYHYFSRTNTEIDRKYFIPCTNQQVILKVLQNFIECFPPDTEPLKNVEITEIIQMMK